MNEPPDPEAAVDLELQAAAALDRLLSIVRAHDPDAYARSERMARLAVALAMTLQVGEPLVTEIERAAWLAGAVPPDAVEDVPALRGAREIAAAVDERFDGTGPRGLAGDAIPLGARIIAVARASAADRPRESGTGHDPMVLGALRMVEETTAGLPSPQPTRVSES